MERNGRGKMKRRTARVLFLCVMACVLAVYVGLWIFMTRSTERAWMATCMDIQELHYGTDGGLILFQASAGLIGVYHVYTPISHIWVKPQKEMKPGRYYVSVGMDWIKLSAERTEAAYVVKMGEKDMRFFRENVQQDTPVIVY